jgi:hypothetical protein
MEDLSPARASELLGRLVGAMFADLDDRLGRLAMRYAEDFAPRLSRLQNESAGVQCVTMEHELTTLRTHVGGMRQSIIDGLTSLFGASMVENNMREVDIRIDRIARAIWQESVATAAQMLPQGAAYGVGQQEVQRIVSEEPSTPAANWLRAVQGFTYSTGRVNSEQGPTSSRESVVTSWLQALHGGQLLIVIAGSALASLVLLIAALVMWVGTSQTVTTGTVGAIALAASVWTVWAMWTWLGARRRAASRSEAPASSPGISPRKDDMTPMRRAIDEHLEWSINDLRRRYCEIQEQRLNILLPRIERGDVDREEALAAEIDEVKQNSEELLPVVRAALVQVAARWCEGTLAVEKVVAEYTTDITDGIAFIRVSTLSALSRRLPLAPLAP